MFAVSGIVDLQCQCSATDGRAHWGSGRLRQNAIVSADAGELHLTVPPASAAAVAGFALSGVSWYILGRRRSWDDLVLLET